MFFEPNGHARYGDAMNKQREIMLKRQAETLHNSFNKFCDQMDLDPDNLDAFKAFVITNLAKMQIDMVHMVSELQELRQPQSPIVKPNIII